MNPARAPRRLLFHIRHFGVGGIENALLGWLQGLDRTLFHVDVSVALPTRELEQVYRARLPADVGLHCLVEPNGWLARLHQRRRDGRLGAAGRLLLGAAMTLAARGRFLRELRRLAPAYDVVIDYDLTLRKIAGSIPAPLVGVRHFGFWARRTAKAARVGRDFRHYDCLAVLNEAMRRQAQTLYGDALPRLAVLPNAFDLSAMRRAAREDGGLDLPAEPYAVCVARLDIPTKGLDVLLQAWRALLAAHPAAPAGTLVLVGDGSDRGKLLAMVRELGLEGRVQFAGLQANPYPWIRRARLLVLASRTEGLPNVLIEAMALDCMVVSTDCPVGPRELLADGRAGLLVAPDDAQALAEAMWRALSDDTLRSACLAAARQQAENYGIEAGNRRMRELVESVLAQAGEAARQ